jgi:ribosomal-protein-serine acetyltransferase
MELLVGRENARCVPLHARDVLELSTLFRLNHSELTQWLPGFGDEFDPETAAIYIEQAYSDAEHQRGFHFGIRIDAQLIGVINVTNIDPVSSSASIGFFLDQRFQGKGIVSGACEALIQWALCELKLNRLSMEIVPENLKSVAVATRLGFQYEGTKRSAERIGNRFVDHAVFSLLAAEFTKAA